jgi:hypothetical protein
VNPIDTVKDALTALKKQDFARYLNDLVLSLAGFDWRTSGTPGLDEALRRTKLVFRGSSGYRELRTQLLEHLAHGEGDAAETADHLMAE